MDKIALTMDLEFLDEDESTSSNRGPIDREKEAVRDLLDILGEKNQRMTFFVVSKVFENHPSLLERIRDEGHEIASHSVTHRYLTNLSDEEVREEIRESKRTLEDGLGVNVTGFRAPALKRPENLFELLEEEGYIYDSSTIPSLRIPGWFGGARVGSSPFQRRGIKEIPVSANPATNLPISGFFLRLLGRRHLLWTIDRLQDRGVIPAMYIHPFELVKYERKDDVKLRHKFRSGPYMIDTVKTLLDRNENVCMSNIEE